MNREIALIVGVMLSVAGCSSANVPAAVPTATVIVTQTVTASPTPVTPPATPAPAGTQVQINETGTKATFFQYKQILDGNNKDTGAFEVEVCLGRDPKDGQSTPGVSSQRWSLRDSKNGVHDQSSGYTGNPVTPMYPEGGALNWGECARGWIIMPITEGTKLTEARYMTSDDKVFSWKI